MMVKMKENWSEAKMDFGHLGFIILLWTTLYISELLHNKMFCKINT